MGAEVFRIASNLQREIPITSSVIRFESNRESLESLEEIRSSEDHAKI